MIWQQKLLHWYRKNRRDLPWRRTHDPYKIWVSEIMLQQTTVETVIPYYERFLKQFPTVTSLAQASEEEVLCSWSGLGYYSRARNLHKAAAILVSCPTLKKGGWGDFKIASNWIKLPGIGRYTAGAIASIAFDERAPILDGNVIRVLSRLFAIRVNPKSSLGQKLFWKKAEAVLPQKSCGDFNQALMELGATVCLSTNPVCPSCPIRLSCRAAKEKNPTRYPVGRQKTVYQSVQLCAAIVEKEGKYLLVRRPDQGLLRGMWEFPMVQGAASQLAQLYQLRSTKKLPPVKHSVLNRRLTITPHLCLPVAPMQRGRFQWFAPQEIATLPTSSMNQKILQCVKNN